MPSDFECSSRNIVTHRNRYKAKEWANWITLHSLLLLKNHLLVQFLLGWSKYVQAVKLCQKHIISDIDILEIYQLFLDFYKYYK
ncbi:20271_t:CDS:1, partial [Cetraspora pellucida]